MVHLWTLCHWLNKILLPSTTYCLKLFKLRWVKLTCCTDFLLAFRGRRWIVGYGRYSQWRSSPGGLDCGKNRVGGGSVWQPLSPSVIKSRVCPPASTHSLHPSHQPQLFLLVPVYHLIMCALLTIVVRPFCICGGEGWGGCIGVKQWVIERERKRWMASVWGKKKWAEVVQSLNHNSVTVFWSNSTLLLSKHEIHERWCEQEAVGVDCVSEQNHRRLLLWLWSSFALCPAEALITLQHGPVQRLICTWTADVLSYTHTRVRQRTEGEHTYRAQNINLDLVILRPCWPSLDLEGKKKNCAFKQLWSVSSQHCT